VDASRSSWRSRAPIGGEVGRRERARLHLRAAGAALLGAALVLSAPGVAGAKAQGAGKYVVLYEKSLPSVTRETDGLERTKGFRSERRFAHAVKGFAARLSAQQAEAFCLRYLEDMDYREISKALRIDVNQVGVVLHRARSRLRQFLASVAGDQKEVRCRHD